jgi:uncharacterized cupin superfamily protein
MTGSEPKFLTAALKPELDYHAPCGAEIRQLLDMSGGGVCHCTLPPGRTSSADKHRSVEEIWYVLKGEGGAPGEAGAVQPVKVRSRKGVAPAW